MNYAPNDPEAPTSHRAEKHAGHVADDPLLTAKEAAAHLRVSKSYLDKLRVYGGGPTFLRFGKRKIIYRRADLDLWAAECSFTSTSEYALAKRHPNTCPTAGKNK